MRSLLLALALAMFALPAHGDSGATVRVDFSNPKLTPSNWTLVIHPDGSGHFHSDRGNASAEQLTIMEPVTVDRDVQLSEQFATRVFQTVRRNDRLNGGCESHLKVAFQGWKKISYSGPDGEGNCEFNYSKNKEIQALGDALVAVASTIVEGARLELILLHDPLGLDREMDYIVQATEDGRLQQLGSIRGILERLESDPAVMERVRKRARMLLTKAGK